MESILSGKRKAPESTTEIIPTYYFKDGYRYVEKYNKVLKFYVKKRWIGHSILDVMQKEFKLYTPEYYVREAIIFRRVLLRTKKLRSIIRNVKEVKSLRKDN